MKFIPFLLTLTTIACLSFLSCNDSSSSDDVVSAYSIDTSSMTSNPYPSNSFSFSASFNGQTYNTSANQFAVAYANGTNAGFSILQTDSNGKPKIKIIYYNDSTATIPTTVGSSQTFSGTGKAIVYLYGVNGQANVAGNLAPVRYESTSTTISFTVKRTADKTTTAEATCEITAITTSPGGLTLSVADTVNAVTGS